MKKRAKIKYLINPNSQPYFGQPDDCLDVVNKYGTYNIQPTADTENTFPTIAQGLPQAEQTREITKDELDEHGQTARL